jgi:acyl-CoA thioester hydrolase
MFKRVFQPRFNDTDALGHINNASYVTWFETSRRPVFELFVPDLDPKKWNLILAKVEVDFLKQGLYQAETEIKTYVTKLGNSSVHLGHEVYQNSELIAKGIDVLVHFDYKKQKSAPIPSEIRKKLETHLKGA